MLVKCAAIFFFVRAAAAYNNHRVCHLWGEGKKDGFHSITKGTNLYILCYSRIVEEAQIQDLVSNKHHCSKLRFRCLQNQLECNMSCFFLFQLLNKFSPS